MGIRTYLDLLFMRLIALPREMHIERRHEEIGHDLRVFARVNEETLIVYCNPHWQARSYQSNVLLNYQFVALTETDKQHFSSKLCELFGLRPVSIDFRQMCPAEIRGRNLYQIEIAIPAHNKDVIRSNIRHNGSRIGKMIHEHCSIRFMMKIAGSDKKFAELIHSFPSLETRWDATANILDQETTRPVNDYMPAATANWAEKERSPLDHASRAESGNDRSP